MSKSTLQGKDIRAAAPSAELLYADHKGLREGDIDAVLERLVARQKRMRRMMWLLALYFIVWGVLRTALLDALESTLGTFELVNLVVLVWVGVLMVTSSRQVTRDLEALERLRDEQRAAADDAPERAAARRA